MLDVVVVFKWTVCASDWQVRCNYDNCYVNYIMAIYIQLLYIMGLMSILGHLAFSCVRLTKFLITLVVICKRFSWNKCAIVKLYM